MTREQYHHEAAECVRMAEQTDDPTTRLVSVGLAQAWLKLAQLVGDNGHTGAHERPQFRDTMDDTMGIAPAENEQA